MVYHCKTGDILEKFGLRTQFGQLSFDYFLLKSKKIRYQYKQIQNLFNLFVPSFVFHLWEKDERWTSIQLMCCNFKHLAATFFPYALMQHSNSLGRSGVLLRQYLKQTKLPIEKNEPQAATIEYILQFVGE